MKDLIKRIESGDYTASEVIAALEKLAEIHKAWNQQYREIERLQGVEYELETQIQWLKNQRAIQERNIEAFRKTALLSYEELENKDARIKHLEGIIERIEKLNNDFLYNTDLGRILNEA